MTMADSFEQRCIISGIGQSEVGRRVTRGVMALTLDACIEAIADAGLEPKDIDGVFSWPGAVTRAEGLAPSSPGSSGPGVHAVIDALRLDTNWYSAGPETPGMLAAVIHGCMAVASGMCRHVLVYRALNEATAWRTNTQRVATDAEGVTGNMQWILPFGAFSGPNWMALYARRHMHEYGTTREQLAKVAVAASRWASLNPDALKPEPLTVDDVLASPLVSDPLRKLDICLVTNGGGAIVLTSRERAARTAKMPVAVLGTGEGHSHCYVSNMRSFTQTAGVHTGRAAYEMAGIGPRDIDVAQIYDAFTIMVLLGLEDLGFCAKGEGGRMIDEGIGPGSRLPVNTTGGGLRYCHPGMFGIFLLVEAVRQLRGECGRRQVARARHVLVHGFGGVLAGNATVILGGGA